LFSRAGLGRGQTLKVLVVDEVDDLIQRGTTQNHPADLLLAAYYSVGEFCVCACFARLTLLCKLHCVLATNFWSEFVAALRSPWWRAFGRLCSFTSAFVLSCSCAVASPGGNMLTHVIGWLTTNSMRRSDCILIVLSCLALRFAPSVELA
jgi:hypothetical protein